MKHFVILGMILLFCFGVLPQFVIDDSYGKLERTAEQVQLEYAKMHLPPEDKLASNEDKNEEVQIQANENTDKKENGEDVKIKPWLKKENIKASSDKEVSNRHFPIEEKILNDHKKERANKEVPGSSQFDINSTNDTDLKKEPDNAVLLKIIDNATIVLNDGIINVKVGM